MDRISRQRPVSKPRLSRFVLAVLWAVTFILLGIAVYRGGGEPLGLGALRKATERPPDPVVEFYNRSRVINQPPAARVSAPSTSHSSWVWWKLTLLSAVISTLFVPIALYNEAKTMRVWIQEWSERRPKRIRLQTKARMATDRPSVTQTVGGTFWSRLRHRIAEHLPGDLLAEFINNIVKWMFRLLTSRR